MTEIWWLVLPSAFVFASVALLLWRTRQHDVPPALRLRPSQVRVVTRVEAPNRDLSATLPHRNRALAEADRHFYGYERVRAPRYRPDLDKSRAEVLRPVQVIRVSSRAEREEIERQVPPHLKVIFLEADADPTPALTQPVSHD